MIGYANSSQWVQHHFALWWFPFFKGVSQNGWFIKPYINGWFGGRHHLRKHSFKIAYKQTSYVCLHHKKSKTSTNCLVQSVVCKTSHQMYPSTLIREWSKISRSSIFIENTYVGHQWDQSNPQCPITATIQSSNMGGGCTIIEAIIWDDQWFG